MKKTTFALAALLLGATTLFAQTTEEYDVNYALAENGATATAGVNNDKAGLSNDGNIGTRWESGQANKSEEGANWWWMVNLGQVRTFNTIQLVWEGAYGKTFRIEYSSDQTDWQTFVAIEGQQLEGFPYTQTFDVPKSVTAQYVRFVGIETGFWGFSFWEFRVFTASPSQLASLEAKIAPLCKLGESTAIEVIAKDQNSKLMTDVELTYEVSPADAGTFAANVFTAAKQGPATITVKSGEIASATVSTFVYAGENVALCDKQNSKIIAQSEGNNDAQHAIDGDEGKEWNGCATGGTAVDEAARTYDAWFVVDLGAFYDVNLVSIKFEGACSQEYHLDFSANNKDWNVAYNYVGNEGVNGHTDYLYGENLQNATSVRFVRFWSTKAATQYGLKIYELKVFATPGQAPADDEKPVLVKAELVENDALTAIIAVEATDNLGVAKFNIKDEANNYTAALAAVDGKITLTGLNPNTTYNLVITVEDLAGNESENSITVKVVTPIYNPAPTTAAPTPKHAEENVISLYSDAYKSVDTFLPNQPWNGWPTLERAKIGEDEYLHYYEAMTGVIGWEFKEVNASEMKNLHVDIWPSTTGTIDLSPIFKNVDGNGQNEKVITLPVEQEKWNSIDILLSDYVDINWAAVFQIKWSNYGTQNQFSIDNVYFWKEGTTTLVNAMEVFPKVKKTIENGLLVIIRDGVKYNAQGQVIE